ncbi:MAG: hypothetical protein ACP5D2_02555 [Candidatus Nanoarchaeia archaeon]
MKRLVILLLLITSCSAAPVLNIDNSTFSNECLIGNITLDGEFETTLETGDILFYEGRKQVYFEHDIQFYNNSYYLYVIFNRAGNFTLKIPKILYNNDGLKEANIQKSISVQDSNQTLKISPCMISTDKQAKIKLINKKNSSLNLTYLDDIIQLNAYEEKDISYQPNQSFSYITIDTYKKFNIPVFYYPISDNEQGRIEINPEYIHLNLITDQEENTSFEIFNLFEKNITLQIESDLLEKSIDMQAKSVKNLSFVVEKDEQGYEETAINITYNVDNSTFKLTIPVYIYIHSNDTNISNISRTQLTCQELGGKLCFISDCQGQGNWTEKGYCCLGECEEQKQKSGSNGWLIGIGIFILLAILGLLIYLKVRKTKPKDKMLNKKTTS